MKNILIVAITLLISISSFASSNITFPANHIEVAPNQSHNIPLFGPGLVRTGVMQ